MDFEIRNERKPQGRKKLIRERAAYFQLMEQGYSTQEAARIVGINLRTGRRWRNGWHSPPGGKKAVPPIYPEPGQTPLTVESEEHPSQPSRYLQERDRIHIADRLREKASVRQIASELGRSPSTISREIRRNRRPMRISRPVKNMVMISERPAEAEDRAVPGHWEGDLIIGKDGRSAIGTLVERATRYLLLMHLPRGHSAMATRAALVDTIKTLPTHLWRSLTWDQGSEMAAHRSFTVATDIPVYFCDPASPWQRGSNENTNGLLRQYFPKRTGLSVHTPEHLAAVATEMNSRPRKTLGWETPAERLAKLLTTGT